MRVDVRVGLLGNEAIALTQIRDDIVRDLQHMAAGQFAKALDKVPLVIERRDGDEAVLFAQPMVLSAATGRDVDDAGALGVADFVPGDHAVTVDRGRESILRLHERVEPAAAALGIEMIEGPLIGEADQLAAGQLAQNLEFARAFEHALQRLQLLGQLVACDLELLDPLLLEVALA
jgi:hypothetical protein